MTFNGRFGDASSVWFGTPGGKQGLLDHIVVILGRHVGHELNVFNVLDRIANPP